MVDPLDLVLIARHGFGYPPLGEWHLSRALAARGHRVLYVEPPPAARKLPLTATRRWREAPVRRLAPRLLATQPLALPRADQPGWARASDALIGRQVARIVRSVFPTPPVVVTFDPRRGSLPAVPRQALVHWRRDRFAAMTNLPGVERLAARDEALMRAADLVCGTVPALVEEAEALGANAALVPNGCDVAHFETPRARPTALPRGDAVLGFAGGAPWRLDRKLIAAVADQRPTWQLVFVGPTASDLPERANVHAVGPVRYDEIPSWLQHFDIGLVPYDMAIALNATSFPLKALEYLAAGTPAVATPMPALIDFAPHVRTASTPAEFIRAAEAALTEGPTAVECRALASANTWEQRADQFTAEIAQLELMP